MLLGREIQLPVDLLLGCPPDSVVFEGDVASYVERLRDVLRNVHENAREYMVDVKSRRVVTIIGLTIRAIRLVTVFSYLSQLGKRVYVQSLKVCGLDLRSYLRKCLIWSTRFIKPLDPI